MNQTPSLSIGRIITVISAIAVLFLFFMPWVSCTGMLYTETASGWEISTQSRPQQTDFPPQLFFLVPLAALAILGVVFTTLGKPRSEIRGKTVLNIVLAGVGLVLPVLTYLDWLSRDSLVRSAIRFEIGFWGTVVAFIASMVGSALDVRESRQKGRAVFSERRLQLSA